MILSGHSDAAYLNVSKYRSQSGSHIFLSKDNPVPQLNRSILTMSQIIKFVMSSDAEDKLAGLFITTKAMLPIRQTLIEMGWPQPKTPVQTYNSIAEGVTNNKIIKRKLNSMDMRLWWVRCSTPQDQFRFFLGTRTIERGQLKHRTLSAAVSRSQTKHS